MKFQFLFQLKNTGKYAGDEVAQILRTAFPLAMK